MSDKAIEVIADTVALFMPERDEGQDGRITLKAARETVAALRTAGIALVEPPEALVRERHNECEWRVDDTVVIRDGFGVTTVHIDDDWMDLGAQPGQLRRLAAALLAAANAAEAVEE